MKLENANRLGELTALLEVLAQKYNVSLPVSTSLLGKVAENPVHLIRVLSQVTVRATEDERRDIAEIIDDVDENIFASRAPLYREAGNVYTAHAKASGTFGLSAVAVSTLLRELREERGMSQADAAKLCGKSRAYWGALEKGSRRLRSTTLQGIANAFGVPYSTLIERGRSLDARQQMDG